MTEEELRIQALRLSLEIANTRYNYVRDTSILNTNLNINKYPEAGYVYTNPPNISLSDVFIDAKKILGFLRSEKTTT